MTTMTKRAPLAAKFGGRCARTGQHYEAGTPITRTALGWEIVEADTALDNDGAAGRLPAAPFARSSTIVGTPQQEAFWQAVTQADKHIVLQARAGTGKSFSILEAARRAIEQQPGLRVGFSAFNKSIATELSAKLPRGAKAFTLHSLGYAAIRRAAGNQTVTVDDEGAKVKSLIRRALNLSPDAKLDNQLASAVSALVSSCKGYLMEGTRADCEWIAARHDVDLAPSDAERRKRDENGRPSDQSFGEWEAEQDEAYRRRLFDLVARVLAGCKADTLTIDLDDMIWLPVVLGLSVEEFDLLLIDESQDMNLCQQRLAFMACPRGRIIVVGDDRQAIYAFRGADARSMERMEEQLRVTERDCVHLPLTATRRCPTKVVEMAKQIVPDFEAMEGAPDGEVESVSVWKVAELAQPDEMVLCRVNAPLVGLAHELLRAGKKPLLRGRDLGKNLRALIKRMQAETVEELTKKIAEHRANETMRLALAGKSAGPITAMQDDCDTVLTLLEGCKTLAELDSRISAIFDNKDARGAITLSSVHSAKGLEAETVYILKPELMPHPNATKEEDREQEENIRYVALTRSKRRLVLAYETPAAHKQLEKQQPELVREELDAEEPERCACGAQMSYLHDFCGDDLEGHVSATPCAKCGGEVHTGEDYALCVGCGYQRVMDDPDPGALYEASTGSAPWPSSIREGYVPVPAATPALMDEAPMDWREEVRALLKQAHDRVPFDEDELLFAIEKALATVPRPGTVLSRLGLD